jgi:hypothetical protein
MAAAADLSIGGPGAAIEDAHDARAKREYRERVDELRAELEEAEDYCDSGRAERLREELPVFQKQRDQQPSDATVAVEVRVNRLELNVQEPGAYPLLGDICSSLRMGTFCGYAPRTPTSWAVSFSSAPSRCAG